MFPVSPAVCHCAGVVREGRNHAEQEASVWTIRARQFFFLVSVFSLDVSFMFGRQKSVRGES